MLSAESAVSIHRLLCLNTVLLILALALINSLVKSTPQTGFSRVSLSKKQESMIAVLKAQNEALLKQRIAYGELHCQLKNVGPTGGFCLNATNAYAGNNHYWDKAFCANLANLFAGKSVLDLGCGLGHYGKCLKDAGTGVTWVGYDGSEGIEQATGGFVRFMDLSMPQQLDEFDWVMSLEVAEHLPKAFEQTLLGNIARHAKEGVVLTWAIPGQGGHHHINEQPNEYAIQQMTQLGFKYDAEKSQAFRAAAELFWFKNTIMVFYRV